MGSIPLELSMDFLSRISMIGDVSKRVMKLGEFLKRLEEEMRKIDTFKRSFLSA